MTAILKRFVDRSEHTGRERAVVRWAGPGLSVIGLGLLAMMAANAWVISTTRALIFDQIERVGVYDVALVLGTSPYTRSGNPNALFSHRIHAAAALYAAGRVRHILVSGANPDRTYNEPRKMYQALRRLNVPDGAITLDYAGYRTLDSIVRARRIFGLSSFVVVSQRYHDYRALFLAREFGVNAVAYVLSSEDYHQKLRIEVREYLARVKAVLDLFVFYTRPRFMGPGRPIDVNPLQPDTHLVRAQCRSRAGVRAYARAGSWLSSPPRVNSPSNNASTLDSRWRSTTYDSG